MGKGIETRERILQIAESAVLAKGFGATSIDEVIAEAGITKSGFFYHFRDKNELARAMLRRYVETEDRLFDDIWGAQNAGMKAIHVPHSDIPTEQLGHSEGRPDAVAHELADIPGLLEQL